MESQESTITIDLVHGGFILTAPTEDGCGKTEVFTSQAKLVKAVRAALDTYSLVAKNKADAAETDAE